VGKEVSKRIKEKAKRESGKLKGNTKSVFPPILEDPGEPSNSVRAQFKGIGTGGLNPVLGSASNQERLGLGNTPEECDLQRRAPEHQYFPQNSIWKSFLRLFTRSVNALTDLDGRGVA
jgi:hypothetical protein